MPATALKISPTMQDVLDRMAAQRVPLVRFPGGFWTLANQPLKESLGCGLIPTWHVSTGTVRAMEKRGLLLRMNIESEAWCDSYEVPTACVNLSSLYYGGYTRESGPIWFRTLNADPLKPCCQLRFPCAACLVACDGGCDPEREHIAYTMPRESEPADRGATLLGLQNGGAL